MASELLQISDAPGNVDYFVVRNAAGEVLDHDDDTFKALGDATEPELIATEETDFGGVNESLYEATLDLADVNSGLAIAQFWIDVYRRAGGSVDLDADLLLETVEIRVADGRLVTGSVGDFLPGYLVKVGFNVTSTIGDYAQLYAWLEFNGQPVTVTGSTCIFRAYIYGAAVPNFEHPDEAEEEDPIEPNAIGQFEYLKHLPGLEDDNKYLIRASITIGDVTIVGQEAIPCIGGA